MPQSYRELPVASLVPNPTNPPERSIADLELVQSVRTNNVLVPLLVQQLIDSAVAQCKYMVQDGHRRLAAAIAARKATVPCIVLETEQSESQALVTRLTIDLHRKDFTPWQKSQTMLSLKRLNPSMTLKEMEETLCVSQSLISRYLAVEKLIPDALAALQQGKMGLRAAYSLSQHSDAATQSYLLEMVLASCPTEQIEGHSRSARNGKKPKENLSRMKFPVPGTNVTVTICGQGLSLQQGVDAVAELLKLMRAAAVKNQSYQTLEKVLCDSAKARA